VIEYSFDIDLPRAHRIRASRTNPQSTWGIIGWWSTRPLTTR